MKYYSLFGVCVCVFYASADIRGAKQGGGLGGLNPPEFWMGGLNTCQPPLILRKKIFGGVGSP